jgi:PhoPQ-activated pathogenicity-related protein
MLSGDYESEGIMEWQNSQEYPRLAALTEPYSFREKLTMPKLLLNATGDQFFLPDSWQFYWDGLVEKNTCAMCLILSTRCVTQTPPKVWLLSIK